MKSELTLQEKLRDLRDERSLKLADVAEATGIPLSTLQRIESADDVRVGYQDARTLAKFYKVSVDYLFALTNNRIFRSIAIDELGLTDAAVEVLKNKRLNNRLVSKLLSHPVSPQLFSSMEVYIDRKILPQMNTMNAVYKMAEAVSRDNVDASDDDAHLKILQESVVDEDEHLRFRITERFSTLMKSLFEAHKKDTLPNDQVDVLNEIKNDVRTYQENKKRENAERAKMILLAKQIGLNLSKLTNEQTAVLMEALRDSYLYKKAREKRK